MSIFDVFEIEQIQSLNMHTIHTKNIQATESLNISAVIYVMSAYIRKRPDSRAIFGAVLTVLL